MSENTIKPIFEPDGTPMKVAVLLSGSGTNFTAIHEEALRLKESGGRVFGEIEAVFTNVPGCPGAKKAGEYGITVLSLSSKIYFDAVGRNPDDGEARDYYDAAVISLIESVTKPDIVVLAGYRRRLGGIFLQRYRNRVLNLYPGDITKPYLVRGTDASVQALGAGERSLKCTVYIENENERFGRALVQSPPVSLAGFTEEDRDSMNEKIRTEAEWKAFPFAVHHVVAGGRAGVDGEGSLYLDGRKLGPGGFQMGGGAQG